MTSPSQHPTRRRVLQGLGVGAAGIAATAAGLPQKAISVFTSPSPRVVDRTPPGYEPVLWSDPRSWENGHVPGPDDVAVIDRPVVIDREAIGVRGVRVTPNGALLFPSVTSALLVSTGNVLIEGALIMRPTNPDVVHTLRFEGVDESKFTGGGMEVLEKDVGLWLTGNGVLDAAGAPKRAWTRAAADLAKGATTISVEDASGWRAGDLVAITPTSRPSPDNGGFHQDVDNCRTYDEARITAVNGNQVTLERPLAYPHPVARFQDWTGDARAYGAEVLNLSRNVVIEGQPNRRAHVMFLHNGASQNVSHVELRHLAPRRSYKVDGKSMSEGVLGRYAFHFHHCGDGSRGSVVEGLVAHHVGGHAFVPHDSHGITMRDCVAHDARDTAFWWDLRERRGTYLPASHDVLWERCVASKVWADATSAEGFRMTGFLLSEGKDRSNRCIGCVAVGVYPARVTMNNSVASGFEWPERGQAIWTFEDCLSHNIGGSGLLTWQNDERVHLLEKFTAYHCGKAGVDHGAYQNFWHYRDMALFANRRAGVAIHATTRRTNSTPKTAPPLLFENIVVDGGGLTQWGVQSEKHRFAAHNFDPTIIRNVRVKGCKGASYHEPKMDNRSYVRLTDCEFASPEFYFHNSTSSGTSVMVDRLNGGNGSFTLRRKDQPGAYMPNWNASRS